LWLNAVGPPKKKESAWLYKLLFIIKNMARIYERILKLTCIQLIQLFNISISIFNILFYAFL